MGSLITHEIRKQFTVFMLVGIVISLAIAISLLSTVSGRIESVSVEQNGNSELYNYTGKEIIEFNKKQAEMYSGRVMDDAFFDELDVQRKAAASYDEYAIEASSLMHFYGHFTMGEGINGKAGDYPMEADLLFGDDKIIYEYTDTWSNALTILSNYHIIVALFAVVMAALSFSKEYSSGMTPIILTTKNGRRVFALGKISAFYIVMTAVYIFLNVFVIASTHILWGAANPFADARLIVPSAYSAFGSSVSCIQIILLQMLIGYSVMLALSAIAIFISSKIKSPYIALAVSVIVMYIPMFIPRPSSFEVLKVVNLLPVRALGLISNWGHYDYGNRVMIVLAGSAVLIAAVFITLAVRSYSRHKAA